MIDAFLPALESLEGVQIIEDRAYRLIVLKDVDPDPVREGQSHKPLP
jgi:hypothetical protein